MIERNYQRETHSDDSDPEEFDVIMRRLVNHFVEPVIDKLVEESFERRDPGVPPVREGGFRAFDRPDNRTVLGLG